MSHDWSLLRSWYNTHPELIGSERWESKVFRTVILGQHRNREELIRAVKEGGWEVNWGADQLLQSVETKPREVELVKFESFELNPVNGLWPHSIAPMKQEFLQDNLHLFGLAPCTSELGFQLALEYDLDKNEELGLAMTRRHTYEFAYDGPGCGRPATLSLSRRTHHEIPTIIALTGSDSYPCWSWGSGSPWIFIRQPIPKSVMSHIR